MCLLLGIWCGKLLTSATHGCRLLEESEQARLQLQIQLQAAEALVQQHGSQGEAASPAQSGKQPREADAILHALKQACSPHVHVLLLLHHEPGP